MWSISQGNFLLFPFSSRSDVVSESGCCRVGPLLLSRTAFLGMNIFLAMSSNFRLQGMEMRQQALAGSRCQIFFALWDAAEGAGRHREDPSVTGKVEKSNHLHVDRIWISAEPSLGCIWAINSQGISAQIPPVQGIRESVCGKCFVSICMGRQKQEKDWEMAGEGKNFVSISLGKFKLFINGSELEPALGSSGELDKKIAESALNATC